LPLGEFRVSVKNQIPFTKIHNLYTQTCININTFFDIIKKGAYWRPRREGDTLLRGGMHKKVRRLMNEKMIPLRLRDTLPLLCDGEGVLYLPFVGWRDGVISQKSKDSDGDTYVVTVEIL